MDIFLFVYSLHDNAWIYQAESVLQATLFSHMDWPPQVGLLFFRLIIFTKLLLCIFFFYFIIFYFIDLLYFTFFFDLVDKKQEFSSILCVNVSKYVLT